MPEIEKQFEWREYWEVFRRRRWVLLGVLFGAGIAGTAVAALWPVRYRSQALILVERQDVPSAYVRPNVTADAQERLATITQQVLSRTLLEGLIGRYQLYPQDPGPADTDQKIAEMRKDIQLDPVDGGGGKNLTALRIEFTYGDPHTAQEVDSDLTSEFINQSLQARAQASATTTDFLAAQLADAQKNLAAQQSRLSDLKTRYLGELPEQEQGNIQILSSLEAQLYAETNARDNAQQQEIYLESLVSASRHAETAASGETPAGEGRASRLQTIDRTLNDLRQKLTALEAKYTSNYPDVVETRDQLAEWQAMRQTVLRQPPSGPPSPAAIPAATADPAMLQVQSRIKATQAEIAMDNGQIASLKNRIASTEHRLRLTPLREQDLAAATRNYDDARDNYESILQKKVQSELATNLERQEEGERLQVIDPASLPQKPVAPNRLEIVLGGWATGLAAGIGLAAAEELADETLRGDFDLRGGVPFPILAHLPILRLAARESRRKWRQIAGITGIAILLLASVAAGIFVCMAG
jgi:polysaccharide chain length determinant protein (PEP-CTERM system associated)